MPKEVLQKIPVIEIFGSVIQGEGITAGCQTHFLRTGGCDYRCSWCDTMYAVLPEEVKKNATQMTLDEICTALIQKGRDTGVKMLTISGGNPLMWDLSTIIKRLKPLGWKIVVETQGTLYRPWILSCDVVTISPKPPSSGMKTNLAKLDKMIQECTSHRVPMCIKIVVFDDVDYDYAKRIFQRYAFDDTEAWLYLQPGTTQNLIDPFTSKVAGEHQVAITTLKKTAWLVDKVLKDIDLPKVRVMPQLHALLYGYQRGV